MNLLSLSQRLRSECGVSGTSTSVVNATGEWSRLVNWVITAWEDIQTDYPEWEWMRKSVSFQTTANKGEYSPTTDLLLTDFGSWRENSFRMYLTSAGVGSEMLLGFKEYNEFRDYYLLASRKTTYSRPTEITVSPSKTLILGLAPDSIYTVSGEYFKNPVTLALDADVPDLPSRFHMAIVYKAMMSYGAYEAASDVYQRGEAQYKQMINKIRYDQLPMIVRGSALV